MTDKQVDALRLADSIEAAVEAGHYLVGGVADCAAAELRRLHTENEALRKERDANLDSITVGNEAITRLHALNAELAGALIGVMNLLVDRNETDEAAVTARAAIAKVEGKQ